MRTIQLANGILYTANIAKLLNVAAKKEGPALDTPVPSTDEAGFPEFPNEH